MVLSWILLCPKAWVCLDYFSLSSSPTHTIPPFFFPASPGSTHEAATGVHCTFGLHLVWRAWPLTSQHPCVLHPLRFVSLRTGEVGLCPRAARLSGDYLYLCPPGFCWVIEILLRVYNKHTLEWERRQGYISLWNSLSDAWYLSLASSSVMYSFIPVFDLLLLEQWMRISGCMVMNVIKLSQ